MTADAAPGVGAADAGQGAAAAPVYDVIVVGLGGMGSAAAYHLAARGRRVLGLDRFSPPHDRGSSHGVSRIIRQAYFEDPAYVPLLLRAYELWDRLSHDTGQTLLVRTGGLMIGPEDGVLVAGSLRSAREHGLAHELLDAAEIRRRFPPMRPSPDLVALYEAEAGYLLAEETIRAHLRLAAGHGADLRFEEAVLAWSPAPGGGVRVRTGRGTYEAERLVLAGGPWMPQLLGGSWPLQVTRQVLFWFEPSGGIEPFLPGRFPIFAWQIDETRMFYGFPALEGPGGGVKTAFHVPGDPCDPDHVERRVSEEEVEAMRRVLVERMPEVPGRLLRTATCLYTNTPDGHFLIAPHPEHPQVVIAAGFSGHGYKFCSVVGEILADLAIEGATRHPIGLFDPGRFPDRAGGKNG